MVNLLRSTFQVGNVVYPLTITSGQDLIKDADPLIFNLLQFIKSILNTYIGDRFSLAATNANLVDAAGNLITIPIKQLVPYSPVDFLQEVQYKFPLLSAARVNETYKELTREWFDITCELQLLYMLPPLTAAQMYQMDSFRSSVRSVILDRLELGWDENYNSGELVFKTAGIEAIKFVKSDYIGILNPKGINTFFPSIMMTFEVKERKNYVDGSFPTFNGIDGYTLIADGYAPDNFDIADWQINY